MGDDLTGRKRTVILPDDLDDEVMNNSKAENFTQKVIELLKLGIKGKREYNAVVAGDLTKQREELVKKQAENTNLLAKYFFEITKENELKKDLMINETAADYVKQLQEFRRQFEEARNNIKKENDEIVKKTLEKFVESTKFFEVIRADIEKLESAEDKLNLIKDLQTKNINNSFIYNQLISLELQFTKIFEKQAEQEKGKKRNNEKSEVEENEKANRIN